MKATIPTAVIEISEAEASEIFYALRHNLEATIESHWSFHPGVYSQQAATKLHIMKQLARMLDADLFASTTADLNLLLVRAVSNRKKNESARPAQPEANA